MALDDLHTTPGHLIRRCQQIAVAIFLEECADDRLTPIQFAVLYARTDTGPIDQVTLGGMLALDRSTLGNVAARLEDRGLLTRGESAADRRAKQLVLTAQGRALVDRARAPVMRAQERLLAGLTADERRQFVDLLVRIVVANNDVSRAPMRLQHSNNS